MGGTIEPKEQELQTIEKNEIVDIKDTKKTNKNILGEKKSQSKLGNQKRKD